MKISFTFRSLVSLSILSVVASQACHQTCGKQPIKYPFGTGQGCGDPRFHKYITCNQNQLTFTTHTNCYLITTIDYSSQVIYITDPTMSTCTYKEDSKGFSLDWDAPFTFHDNTIFALLDCATTSSIFKANGENNSMTSALYCDTYGASVCNLLNSCQSVSKLDTDIYSAISTCCVYDPIVLGPSFEMNLQKLQCESYSGIYGFDGKNMDPRTWNYGVALKYKFNFNNDYPTICADCEKSNGVCGYYGEYDSFVCNCLTGINTSTSCFMPVSWNSGSIIVPWQTGAWFMYIFAFFLMLM